MNALKVCVALGLVASIAALSPLSAVAGETSSPPQLTVSYNELNAGSENGARALYVRLRSASRQVCASFDGSSLRQRSKFKSCYQQALTNAVGQVNHTAVTALHSRAIKSTKA